MTTAEASVCLAVNQASSIQSIGGTCESITIGHNPSKLPLSKQAITLDACRPQFLCEKILDDVDEMEEERRQKVRKSVTSTPAREKESKLRSSFNKSFRFSSKNIVDMDATLDRSRSSARLLGKIPLYFDI